MKAHKVKNNGKWVWRVRIPNGRNADGNYLYAYVYANTSKDAVEKGYAKREELKNKNNILPTTDGKANITLEEGIKKICMFWDTLSDDRLNDPEGNEGIEPKTAKGYKSNIEVIYKTDVDLKTDINDIDSVFVEDKILNGLKDKKFNLSKRQQERCFQKIHAMLVYLKQRKQIREVATRDFLDVGSMVKPPKYKPSIDNKLPLSDQDIIKVHNYLDAALKFGKGGDINLERQAALAIKIQLASGTRIEEVLPLEYKDFDWKNVDLTISKSQCSPDRVKKTKAGSLRKNPNDKGVRVVWFNRDIQPHFQFYVSKQAILLHDIKDISEFKIFTTLKEAYVHTFIQKMREELGIIQMTTKSFRRYFMTKMKNLKTGDQRLLDATDIRLQVGHADELTQQDYIDYTTETTKLACENNFRETNN